VTSAVPPSVAAVVAVVDDNAFTSERATARRV
jgi:hypothetical protein